MTLSGWGRLPRLDCRMLEPDTPAEVVAAVRGTARLIARGAGRAYGDAAMNPAATLSMLRLNRFRSFDDQAGVVDCEAGVTLDDLIDLVLPRGWFPMVTPGTRFVTVGGAIAADVHGKNHHVDGSFGDHVVSLELVTAEGDLVRCGPDEQPDLYRRTVGGMGLTGVILSARLGLRRVSNAFIAARTRRHDNIDSLLAGLDSARTVRYAVAWIDTLARGGGMGRGILTTGDHAPAEALPRRLQARRFARPGRVPLAVPIELPGAIARGPAVRLFNALYHNWPRQRDQLVDVDRFFYPLDAISSWNRLYGPSGFLQFQCVLPAADGGAGIARILERVSAAGRGSTLAVLKRLGPGRGGLSFPLEGHTLALDMAADDGSIRLYRELCDLTAAHGGRIYLAKDALATPAQLDAFYPDSAAFRAARERDGSARRFGSALSDRLAL